jgi:hypothetical protein
MAHRRGGSGPNSSGNYHQVGKFLYRVKMSTKLTFWVKHRPQLSDAFSHQLAPFGPPLGAHRRSASGSNIHVNHQVRAPELSESVMAELTYVKQQSYNDTNNNSQRVQPHTPGFRPYVNHQHQRSLSGQVRSFLVKSSRTCQS